MTGSSSPAHRPSSVFALAAGAVLGLLFHLLLFGLSVLQYQGADYMGVQDADVEGMIRSSFRDTIAVTVLRILAAQALTGLLAGGALAAWLDLVLRALGRSWSRLRLAGALLGLLVFAHLCFLGYGMTRYPALFMDQFYNAGGLRHVMQAIPSEYIPLWLYVAAAILFVGSFPALLARLHWARLMERRPGALACVGGTGVLALLLVLMLAGGRPDAWRFRVQAPAEGRPNVLWLVADSLRPDYMEQSHEGGFSKLAAEGVTFGQAYTNFARTFPAWVTMLSGQYPHTHGVRHMFPSPEELAKHYPGLPRLLAEQGWEPAVFSDFAGDIFGRFDIGFEHVEVPEFSVRSNVKLALWKMQVHLLPYLIASGTLPGIADFAGHERYADPEILTDRFLGWLAQRDASRPYFGVLFYSASHFPYPPVYPYYRDRRVKGYSGIHRFSKVGLGDVEKQMVDADVEQVRQDFLATVESVDVQVKRVLDLLEATGQLDNTVVVVTSDHGELVYENGRGNCHGDMLNGRESLQIPLVIKLPGRAEPVYVDRRVSQVDLAPTLLGVLGLEVPAWMEGVNLAAYPGYRPEKDLPVYAETGLLFVDPDTEVLKGRSIRYSSLVGMFEHTPEAWEIYLSPKYEKDAFMAKHRMLLEGDYKLIYIPTRQRVKFECYDVSKDPDELNNLYTKDPPKPCLDLKEKLYRFMLDGKEGTRVGDWIIP